MPGKGRRVGCFAVAERPDVVTGWQVPGTKERVPDDELVPVIVVGLADVRRVVPSVQLRPGDDVVERTETHVAVGVLEEPIHGVEDVVAGEDPLVHAQKDERERVDEGLNQLFERVEATDVEPVEPVG